MKLKSLIGFIVAALLTLQSIIQVLVKNLRAHGNNELETYNIVSPVLYAAIGLALILIFILLKYKFWRYAFVVLILLSFTSLIQFSHVSFKIGAGIIGIDVFSLSILILHLIVNPEIYQAPKDEKKKIIDEQNKINEKMILMFMDKFGSKSKDELIQIINENKHTTEAMLAAKKLLETKEQIKATSTPSNSLEKESD